MQSGLENSTRGREQESGEPEERRSVEKDQAASSGAGLVLPSLPETLPLSRRETENKDSDLPSLTDLLKESCAAETLRHNRAASVLTIDEYLGLVENNPLLLRSSAAYLLGAMEVWGPARPMMKFGRDILVYDPDHRNPKPLFGQEIALHEIGEHLRGFVKKGRVDRFIIVHGGPGAGKSQLQEWFAESLVEYSNNSSEGVRYRLGWVLDASHPVISGFDPNPEKIACARSGDDQYIYLASHNTDPFTLLDNRSSVAGKLSAREQALEVIIKKFGGADKLPVLNREYVMAQELDSFSRSVKAALLDYYNGDADKVVQYHARAVRWRMHALDQDGIVSQRNKVNTDTVVVEAFPTNPLVKSDVPEIVDRASSPIFRAEGIGSRSNHALHQIRDPLRAGGDDRLTTLSAYLETIEHGYAQYPVVGSEGRPGIVRYAGVPVDVVVIMDAQSTDILALGGYPFFNSLNALSHYVRVPYILSFQEEAKVHRDGFQMALAGRASDPLALEIFSMFVVATRLFEPDRSSQEPVQRDFTEPKRESSFDDPKLVSALRKRMTVAEKALLYNGSADEELLFRRGDAGTDNDQESERGWDSDELRSLRRNLDAISREFVLDVGPGRFIGFEGRWGISTREAKSLLEDAVAYSPEGDFTVIELLEYLNECAETGFEFSASMLGIGKEIAKFRKAFKDALPGARRGLDGIEDRFQAPDAQKVLKDVEQFAKFRVRLDLLTAVKSNENLDDPGFALKRYVHHLTRAVAGGETDIPEEYRHPNPQSREPSEELMREIEGWLGWKKRDSERRNKRQKLFGRISARSIEGGPLDYEDLFADIALALKKARLDADYNQIYQILNLLEEHGDSLDELKAQCSNDDPVKRRAALDWHKAAASFEEKGYPRGVMVKLAVWSLQEYVSEREERLKVQQLSEREGSLRAKAAGRRVSREERPDMWDRP
jgi:hypothetical protein